MGKVGGQIVVGCCLVLVCVVYHICVFYMCIYCIYFNFVSLTLVCFRFPLWFCWYFGPCSWFWCYFSWCRLLLFWQSRVSIQPYNLFLLFRSAQFFLFFIHGRHFSFAFVVYLYQSNFCSRCSRVVVLVASVRFALTMLCQVGVASVSPCDLLF